MAVPPVEIGAEHRILLRRRHGAALLADDVGIAFGEADSVPRRRDDYALAAGADPVGSGSGAIATGTDSVNWAGVPPRIFDAAENTIAWRVDAADGVAKAAVRVDLSGPGLAAGIAVRLQSGTLGGASVLDADGVATFAVVDEKEQPVTESVAWDHDWRSTAVTVGAGVEELPQTRERIRDFARARLREPALADRREGYVVRTADSFAYGEFRQRGAKFVRPEHVQTIPEIAESIGIQQNYLYRVLPALQKDGLVRKEGRGWHPREAA